MSKHVTLWGDEFAPITSRMGFLRAPFDDVVDGLATWRRALHGVAQVELLPGGLRDHVRTLEPLTSAVRPRELVVATANAEWTAIVDCGYPSGDPISRIGHLARTMLVQGLAVASVPSSPEAPGRPSRRACRQFEMFGPVDTDFLNYVRTISLVQYSKSWRFDANGTVQDFEDVTAYENRRTAERFTAAMLVDYCAELGLKPFDGDFYPGPSALVRTPASPPPGTLVLSLREAQEREGITT